MTDQPALSTAIKHKIAVQKAVDRLQQAGLTMLGTDPNPDALSKTNIPANSMMLSPIGVYDDRTKIMLRDGVFRIRDGAVASFKIYGARECNGSASAAAGYLRADIHSTKAVHLFMSERAQSNLVRAMMDGVASLDWQEPNGIYNITPFVTHIKQIIQQA